MKLYSLFYLVIVVTVLTSCTSPQSPPQSQPDITQANQSQKVVTLDKNFKAVMGETIYVPIYSQIYHGDKKRTFDLAATLSIRNTDLTHSIIITSVRYYDSNGKPLKQYLERPIQLDALASTEFVVDRTDSSGGVGANFIVEWVAQTKVYQPVVEAVMIGTDFQQGISWISPGKVIKSQSNDSRIQESGVRSQNSEVKRADK